MLSIGSPKNFVALLLELQQSALDSPDAGGGNVSVLRPDLSGVVAEELQHRAQVGEVQQQESVVVRDAKAMVSTPSASRSG